jgi:hypothetical protein
MIPFAAFGSEVRKIGSDEERKDFSLPFSDLLIFLTS